MLVYNVGEVLARRALRTPDREAVVDLASPQRHPLAKIAKDVAAGTVLLAAMGAVVVGCLIFLAPLWALIQQLFTRR